MSTAHRPYLTYPVYTVLSQYLPELMMAIQMIYSRGLNLCDVMK